MNTTALVALLVLIAAVACERPAPRADSANVAGGARTSTSPPPIMTSLQPDTSSAGAASWFGRGLAISDGMVQDLE